ncbi:Winged helix DNA-binding domain superfamily [Sesbania bispinosa]|nr:Winged helix DNA-binding domain superfamily [Sesbania bispinosa]
MEINQRHGAEELFQAQTHLYKYTYSFIASMCLKSAVHLGIPDIIYNHGQPITIPELVLALQIDPAKSGYVYRLMRLLVHAGFFATTKTKVVKDDEKEEVGNVKFVGGDMFQSIPSADAILLKLVLHAYSDEECVKVLKKCREAISNEGKGGKVIIIDIVIGEKNDDKDELTEAKLFFDLLMMVVVSGREREEKEWKKLFLEAGFSHYKITPIFGMRSLIEVYP